MIDKIVAAAICIAAFYLLVEALYKLYRLKNKEPMPEIPPDPVKHCQVYKAIGCAHVDGYLCNMNTCNITTTIQFRPKFKRIVDPYESIISKE